MTLHIQYRNDKFDYVNGQMLDRLINEKEIKKFYRPSEKKWIDVDIGPLRGMGGGLYMGKERRQSLQ